MALIKCPDCNKEVSDKSSVCIHCGCPLSLNVEEPKQKAKKVKNKKGIKIGVFVLLFIVLAVALSVGLSIYFKNKDIVEVPNLSNISEENGVTTLISNDLIPNIIYEYNDSIEEGRIISTNPKSDSKVKKNSTVDIIVSKGPQMINAVDSTIQWNNISVAQDTWQFSHPYILDEYLYIRCQPVFGTSFRWKDGGFGVASITDTFSKKVPVTIITENEDVVANETQYITLKVSTKDLDVKKPTTLHMELIGVKDNHDINIEISFTISW